MNGLTTKKDLFDFWGFAFRSFFTFFSIEAITCGTSMFINCIYVSHGVKQTDLFLVCVSQHLDALQIDDTLQTLLGVLRLLPTATAILAGTDEAAEKDQSSNDSNADDGPERNWKQQTPCTHCYIYIYIYIQLPTYIKQWGSTVKYSPCKLLPLPKGQCFHFCWFVCLSVC